MTRKVFLPPWGGASQALVGSKVGLVNFHKELSRRKGVRERERERGGGGEEEDL